MAPPRLRAPARDGEALARPPLSEVPGRCAGNRRRLQEWRHDFQGRTADRLRALARREILAGAREFHRGLGLAPLPEVDPAGPLVVTGHQSELFHPGVWAKNFAAGALARGTGGGALNLIVDNDVPHGAFLRVPTATASGMLRTVLVDFDERSDDAPFEDWAVRDERRFADFADRVRAILDRHATEPLLDDFWPHARAASDRTDRVGLRFAAARHAIEVDWGLSNAEFPLSLACQTEAFAWFLAHLLAQSARFRVVHNACLDQYRRRYRIRSRNHPVSALRCDGEWCEVPFWAWRRDEPRRRALLARQRTRSLDLRIAGEAEPLLELPLTPEGEACCAVERLRELPERGVRLRTRALTTTMFARLLVGDLFIHGIGGARYDELGDAIIREFFGLEPPDFLTYSMTVWLDLPDDPATPETLRAVRHQIRELTFNPDRYLPRPRPAGLDALVAAKRQTIAAPTATRRQRVERYTEFRRLNEALRENVRDQLEVLRGQRVGLERGLARNRVARGREFAFVLHPGARLERLFHATLPGGWSG